MGSSARQWLWDNQAHVCRAHKVRRGDRLLRVPRVEQICDSERERVSSSRRKTINKAADCQRSLMNR